MKLFVILFAVFFFYETVISISFGLPSLHAMLGK
jgi:hypothetical protein